MYNYDISVIALLWLTLSDMDMPVVDWDLTEPGFILRRGGHVLYTCAVLLDENTDFPEHEFCSRLKLHSMISKIKVNFYGIEKYSAYSAHEALYTGLSKIYVTVYI